MPALSYMPGVLSARGAPAEAEGGRLMHRAVAMRDEAPAPSPVALGWWPRCDLLGIAPRLPIALPDRTGTRRTAVKVIPGELAHALRFATPTRQSPPRPPL